jgi:2-methylisocitrate lyase-like PEP mutase family enzyme
LLLLLPLPCSDEGADILIQARSDARQAESFAETLCCAAAFARAETLTASASTCQQTSCLHAAAAAAFVRSCSDEGADILILARSDARQAESLDEALWRAAAFADAGADMLFIDALASKEEMLAFTQLGGAAAGLPKV